MKNLQHQGIISMYEYGDAGQVVKPSGRVIENLVYIVMEFVQGGLLFDLCQSMGAMGEDAGRFFLHQMLDSVEFMHSRRVVHRDLKLENILVDDNLNLKLADFGTAKRLAVAEGEEGRGEFIVVVDELEGDEVEIAALRTRALRGLEGLEGGAGGLRLPGGLRAGPGPLGPRRREPQGPRHLRRGLRGRAAPPKAAEADRQPACHRLRQIGRASCRERV